MKKNIIVSLLSLAFFTCLQAQVKPHKIVIEVSYGNLLLNDASLSDSWLLKSATNVLGAPSKQKQGSNKTHTYNNYGIVLFESSPDKTPSGKISEMQVYLYEPVDKNDIVPDGYFQGTFKIGEVALHKNLTAAELREKLNDYKESDSYMPHNYRLSKDGLYFYFQYNDADDMLIKVSVGKDLR